MSLSAFSLTPHRVMHVARAALVAVSALALALAAVWPVPVIEVAATFYLATIVLHLAYPRMRSADLNGMLTIVATGLCFTSGDMLEAAGRWLATLAAIGLAMVPMKTMRMRALMTIQPYTPLNDRRRSARRHRPDGDERRSEPRATILRQESTPVPQSLPALPAPDA